MLNSPQYEYINEESIDRELICVICDKPFENPRCTPCDHTFCQRCITRWIAEKNPSCPTCRQRLLINQLKEPSRLVRNILGNLRIKCVECKKTDFERSNFEQHINTTCSSTCLAADIMCPWVGVRGQLQNHLTNCNYQILRPVLTPLIAEGKQLKKQVSQQNLEVERLRKETQQLKNELKQYEIRHQKTALQQEEIEKRHKYQINQYLNELQQTEERAKKTNARMVSLQEVEKSRLMQINKYQEDTRHLKEQLTKERHIAENHEKNFKQLENQLRQCLIKNEGYQAEISSLKKKIEDQSIQSRNELQQLKLNEMHYEADVAEYKNKIDHLEKYIEEELQNQNSQQTVWSRISPSDTWFRSSQTGRRSNTKRFKREHL